jgi:hypothetical protein
MEAFRATKNISVAVGSIIAIRAVPNTFGLSPSTGWKTVIWSVALASGWSIEGGEVGSGERYRVGGRALGE